jgi:hypothetical protein
MAFPWNLALPIIGSAVGGLFGGGAAAPAAAGATSAAQSEADLLNTLMGAYKNVYAPAEQQSLQQMQATAAAVPTQQITQAEILRNLLPTTMPDILRSRAQYGIQGQTDRTAEALAAELRQRGISGPAAESILGHVREQGIQSQAQLGSDIGAWEANQTLANRGTAYKEALAAQALPAQYAQTAASRIPGVASPGALDLTRLLGGAAQGAAAPYVQAGKNIGTAAGAYFSNPQYYQPSADMGGGPDMTNMYPPPQVNQTDYTSV